MDKKSILKANVYKDADGQIKVDMEIDGTLHDCLIATAGVLENVFQQAKSVSRLSLQSARAEWDVMYTTLWRRQYHDNNKE